MFDKNKITRATKRTMQLHVLLSFCSVNCSFDSDLEIRTNEVFFIITGISLNSIDIYLCKDNDKNTKKIIHVVAVSLLLTLSTFSNVFLVFLTESYYQSRYISDTRNVAYSPLSEIKQIIKTLFKNLCFKCDPL